MSNSMCLNQTSAKSEKERLQFRASERFRWHWAPVRVADTPWKIATASDPDGMLLEACQRQDAGEQGVIDPFWAAVWRASAGLDRFLESYALEGTRVLEVGCGTGRAGLSAALRGAQVTLTDGVSDPLLLVQLTVWALAQRCTVRRLRFGLDILPEKPYPLILGSDVTYLRQLWPELDRCLRQHLAAGGEVLLSDPYRIIANEFRDWIQAHGWDYREHKVVLADDPEHPIRIMQLRVR
ncbi:class I SAM-dependent methyltransferase [Roseimaritima ulvae]|uniref:Methyltransferase n=1 Tax=Roseimaritima ulvae TaxID=980254 RepID=A0A5B9QY19_9BACT|nr:methyltransferase domain-containing protein [Roseimaritima ulvae]QEG38843.1 Putative methyltransferase [Roseimaritima ulvae]